MTGGDGWRKKEISFKHLKDAKREPRYRKVVFGIQYVTLRASPID